MARMRLVWLVAVLFGCSPRAAPGLANQGSIEKGRLANDCPPELLGPWARETFPACLPWFFRIDLPVCASARCEPPCASRKVGHVGDTPVDRKTTYRYDERGRFVAALVDGASRRSCAYDEQDRVATCEEDGELYRVHAIRDDRGRITQLMDAAGVTQELRYDDAGRLIAVGDTTLRYDGKGWLIARGDKPVAHDAWGRVTREGNGKDAWTYEYDGDRLVRVKTQSTQYDVDYDAAGRVHRVHIRGIDRPTDLDTIYEYECH
jgi:YD repeat-containing protein